MRTNSNSWYSRRSRRNANGTYNSGTRAEWLAAYRRARARYASGFKCDETGTGVEWKAELIVQFERNRRDGILPTPATNRALNIMIDEIFAEIEAEEAND